jgi:hypothetical protein
MTPEEKKEFAKEKVVQRLVDSVKKQKEEMGYYFWDEEQKSHVPKTKLRWRYL